MTNIVNVKNTPLTVAPAGTGFVTISQEYEGDIYLLDTFTEAEWNEIWESGYYNERNQRVVNW